jgi:hypothetical protein
VKRLSLLNNTIQYSLLLDFVRLITNLKTTCGLELEVTTTWIMHAIIIMQKIGNGLYAINPGHEGSHTIFRSVESAREAIRVKPLHWS